FLYEKENFYGLRSWRDLTGFIHANGYFSENLIKRLSEVYIINSNYRKIVDSVTISVQIFHAISILP
ncbi:aspartate-semialdehyde dehydrogenase, partial [Listeria seeligeri FSL S4-171]